MGHSILLPGERWSRTKTYGSGGVTIRQVIPDTQAAHSSSESTLYWSDYSHTGHDPIYIYISSSMESVGTSEVKSVHPLPCCPFLFPLLLSDRVYLLPPLGSSFLTFTHPGPTTRSAFVYLFLRSLVKLHLKGRSPTISPSHVCRVQRLYYDQIPLGYLWLF